MDRMNPGPAKRPFSLATEAGRRITAERMAFRKAPVRWNAGERRHGGASAALPGSFVPRLGSSGKPGRRCQIFARNDCEQVRYLYYRMK